MKDDGYLNIYDGKLRATLVPYLWVPNLNGSLNFNIPTLPHLPTGGGTATANFHVGPNQLLSALNAAFMGSAEVRKGDWALDIDYIGLSVSSKAGTITAITGPHGRLDIPVDATIDTKLSGTVWQVAPAFTLTHGPSGAIDIFAGVRGLNSTATGTWNLTVGNNDIINRTGTASGGITFSDFILGVRGNLNLGTPRWSIPYLLDTGGLNDNTTYEGRVGLSYNARHGQSIFLDYRSLQYNGGPNRTLQVIRFSGPMLGYAFEI
jgi:hypothetical protein